MKHRLHAFCCGLFVVLPLFGFSAHAADELLIYVFAQDGPVAGVEVTLDQEVVGVTEADGSLMADVIGDGGHVLSVAYDGRSTTTRFSAGGGQLVDAVARLELEDEAISVDVYSQTESVADREQAAEGTIFIKVLREGEPLTDEPIYIAGTSSLQSDESGESSVALPRGRYRVQVAEQTAYLRVVGGVTRAVTVSVNAEGDTIEVAAPALEEVTVIAKFDPSGLELSERDTSNIVDTIGVELLSRFADSDVAASVVRVPGISVQDDKYVFIRGLGGRYISSTLNNATMPSTNPSKRTVPLDLFPSNFVNQLDIKKTFLPYMPGESTGGNLVINTKTFPDERSGRVSFNLGYVTDITGKDVFVDPIDGDFDDLGWDDGSRAEDGAVEAISQILSLGRVTDTNSGVSYELDDQTRGELQRLGGILIKDGYDLDFETATPDAGLQLDYGDLFYFRDSEIGFYAAANYKNEWNQRDQGVRNSYTPTGDLLDNFIYRQYSHDVEISGLVSVGVNIGNTTLEWNTVGSRVTQSQVERAVGQEGDENQTVYRQTTQWEERQYASTQLLGSHFLNDDGSLFLEWQATASQAHRYAPDRREIEFRAGENLTDAQQFKQDFDFRSANDEQNIDYRGFALEPGVVLRRYDDLIDNNFDVSADLSWDIFDSGASFAKLRVGGQAIYRERDSDTSVYGYNINQARDELLDSDNLLASDVIYVCGDGPGTVVCPANPDLPGAPPEGGISNSPNTGLVFDDKTLASDSYEADLKYNSVYAMYDHTFASSWQVVFGARYEMYEQTTDTFSLAGEQLAVQSVIDEDSVLPSLGVNWFYSETQQLRFAVSQTVARPDFKEAANATFYDNEFNFRVRGNPFLDISDIINADLRWEWFPNETDSYSVAVFYKDMTDPIERVVQPASGTAGNSRTFQNSDEAELYGAEIEGSTEFVLTDDYNQTVFVSFNAAYIESEVTAGNQDNRPLQGQPEYTANLVLGYDNLSAGHQLTLLFNYNGESIADVGVSGAPDVYLEPRGELNFVYRYDISDSATVRARIENILNAEVEYTQGGLVFQSYEKGTTFQLGVDWTF
ncbi:MAG: TonB-dependent receptor domain-containing protein [Luminiphilus sp.]